MYRDLSKGNHVEVEQILGDILERGREFGVVTPLMQTSYADLRVYEARLSVK
jgi:2-dehydropantoate 2-reductase